METYIKSFASDFGGKLSPYKLVTEINDSQISQNCQTVKINSDVVSIIFENALTAGEIVILDVVISEHTEFVTNDSEIFDTIVDVNNTGQFTSISAAFAAGYESVYVRNGVYVETQNIIIPDGGKLIGESLGNVIIFFIGTCSVKMDGSGGTKQTQGTISITNNTKTVNGTNTLFSQSNVGEFILLGTNFFQIQSIVSDTELLLGVDYIGNTLTDIDCFCQPMFTGCSISNFIITGSASNGLYIRGVRHGDITSIAIDTCGAPMTIIDCADYAIRSMIISNMGNGGMYVNNSCSISLSTINIFNCKTYGTQLGGVNIVCECLASENNDGDGITILANSNAIHLHDSVSKYNNGNGIVYESATLHGIISNAEMSYNSGWGAIINGVNCKMVSCVILDNANGINVANNLTSITNNTIDQCGTALTVNGSNNRIMANNISSCVVGIMFDQNCANCIVSNNTEESNTTGLCVKQGCSNVMVSTNILSGVVDDEFSIATMVSNIII